MVKKVLHIWPEDSTVTLTILRDENTEGNRSAVIVVPGGAYIAPSPKEAEPVAEHFAARGYLACVLRASTMFSSFDDTSGAPNQHTKFPEPMQQLGQAVYLLRTKASEFGISPDKIAVMGFSAGGHLAANYGNYWRCDCVAGGLKLPAELLRPNASVLCYAAVRFAEGSAMERAVLGEEKVNAVSFAELYDGSKHVNSDTPPTFIWHTADDAMVSVQQAVDMAEAVIHAGRVCEVHIFSSGPHASALAVGQPAEAWCDLADSFMQRVMI